RYQETTSPPAESSRNARRESPGPSRGEPSGVGVVEFFTASLLGGAGREAAERKKRNTHDGFLGHIQYLRRKSILLRRANWRSSATVQVVWPEGMLEKRASAAVFSASVGVRERVVRKSVSTIVCAFAFWLFSLFIVEPASVLLMRFVTTTELLSS